MAAADAAPRIAASDAERARWARELHDETLQELSAVKIALSSARRSDDPAALREAVETALEYSEHAIRGLREIISDLRPAALDALGTQAAIENLAERARARSGLEVELTIDLAYESGREATRHASALEVAIYRIAQEAITNVVKHAEATSVVISLIESAGTLALCVEDNGRGFADGGEEDAGFGLIGMRERVELLGGTLSVTSPPQSVPASR